MEDGGAGGDLVGIGSEGLAGGGDDDGIGPLGVGVFQQRGEVAAVHGPGLFDAGELEHGGDQIDAGDGRGTHLSLWNAARHGEDERGADVGIVGGYFDAAEAVLTKRETLIGREDNEGVFELFGFAKRIDEFLYGFIERVDALMILADPGDERTAGGDRFAVGVLVPHIDFLGPIGLAGARREDVLGCVDIDASVVLQMALGGCVGAVNGTVAKPEIPGFGGVAAVAADEIGSPIGVLIGRVTLQDFGLAAVIGDGLVVVVMRAGFGVFGAIPDELEVPVTAKASVGAGVPFADLGGEVAVVAESFGPEGAFLRVVSATGVGAFHAHGFDAELIVAGEEGGAGGHAPRADVGGGEADTFFGEGVNVGSFDPGVGFRVGADGAIGMVVGVDE